MTKYLRFMRHGQTELNVRNCWQGHTDAPLTELGRRQSAESGLHLRESDIQLDHVFCSPLGRARETLEIALPGIAERGYELVDGLMEMSFGSLDGTVNSDNVVGPYHDYFLQFGGESEEHAEKRICSTLEGLMLRDDVRSALVVSHGTMGRLFKNHWKGALAGGGHPAPLKLLRGHLRLRRVRTHLQLRGHLPAQLRHHAAERPQPQGRQVGPRLSSPSPWRETRGAARAIRRKAAPRALP